MKVEYLDPYVIARDEMNERGPNTQTAGQYDEESEEYRDGLEDSIEKLGGPVQIPVVRKLEDVDEDAQVQYGVIIGSRRVSASQSTGIDRIPVLVVDWDDPEALEASITENIRSFQEDVDQMSRAVALDKYISINDITKTEAANRLGLSINQINQFLEPLEWGEETIINPNYSPKQSETQTQSSVATTREDEGSTESSVQVDSDGEETVRELSLFSEEQAEKARNVGVKTLKNIRGIAENDEQAERMAVQAAEQNTSLHDMTEIRERVEKGENPEEAMKQVAEEKAKIDTSNRRRVKLVYSGTELEALEDAAKDEGVSVKSYIEKIVRQDLVDGGYL